MNSFLPQRIGRLEYFTWWLPLPILYVFVTALYSVENTSYAAFGGPSLILLFAYMITFWIIVAPRRCRDLDKSGWFVLWGLVPVANIVVGLYLMFAAGTQGPNKYGPQPSKRIAIWSYVRQGVHSASRQSGPRA